MRSAPLTLQLFGSLRVTVGGEPMPRVRTHSVEWLLALLVLRHGRAVDRAWLAGTLWPESSGSRALQNLRNDLVRLRQALGPESGRLRASGPESLTLDLAGAAVDVIEFDAAIQAGDEAALRRAVTVYTGPLLEGCLEEWVLSERAARAEQFLAALETLAEHAAARGDHPEAIRYLRQAQALDPLRDSLPRRLMTSLAAAGDPAAAIQTYRDFRLRLQEELAAAPDETTTRLFHEIRAAARHPVRREGAGTREAGGREDGTITPSPSHPLTPSPPHPPPLPLTALIGREQELEQIRQALAEARLVTLVGGGGVGKTRLALELALHADDAAAGGAAWVELAPLADGGLLLPTVAAALGIRDEAGAHDPDALKRRLVDRLSDGPPLLVLDNCEHLIEAAAGMARWLLERCPELRILATSRQRLGLAGERVWRVPSLPVPGEVDGSSLMVDGAAKTGSPSPSTINDQRSTLASYASVQLFVERAAAVHPGFRLASSEDALAVAQICRRLDGIPLAIELAAARAHVLTPPQIAARLDDRFALLSRGARGVLPRHQTLRALIDWSYDSLSDAEAALLRRLAVFAGGWTLEAAEAVAALQGPGIRGQGSGAGLAVSDLTPTPWSLIPHEVLDLLDALVERSLVLADHVPQGLRYRMLETVREYAREKLTASAELAAVRDRHRDWYLQLAEQLAAAAGGPEQAAGWVRLEGELGNLRAALAWCLEEAEADPEGPGAAAGLRLVTASWWLWHPRGRFTEGLHWLEGALERGRHLPPALRAPALAQAAHLCAARGEWDRSRSFLQAARRESEASLAIVRREGNRKAVAEVALSLSAMAFEMDELEATERFGAEARQLFAELEEPLGLAGALQWMAGVALRRQDRPAARALLEERLAICRKLGDTDRLIHALGGLGHLEREEGNYARAGALYRESLLLRRESGALLALAQSLEDLAALASRQQQPERAIRLLGAEEAFCETLGARPPVAILEEYKRTVAEGRAALGEAAFAAVWAEGQAMSLDQAVEYALEEG